MLSAIVKRLLSLRYRISVTGLDQISASEGVLVIPNHPAEIDPVVVSAYLWDRLHPRPVVLESMYNLPILHPLMRRVKAIPMPDMDFEAGPYKRRRVERAVEDVVSLLKSGQNVLMYPAGRLSVTGAEKLGGTSGLATILKAHPRVNLCLVRTRGLYGSIFSKALNGGVTPDVGSTIKRGISILLQNLIFFAPRRTVTMEIAFNPPDLPRRADSVVLNRYLEQFYNYPQPESAIVVPYTRWQKTLPEIPARRDEQLDLSTVPEDLKQKVFTHIARAAGVPVESINVDTQLGDDLGLDSLTVAELLMWLDREFEVHDVELSDIISVGSVLRAALGQLGSTAPKREVVVPPTWNRDAEARPDPELRGATSICSAFLTAATLFAGKVAVGDDRSGVLSWDDVKLRVVLIAKHLATLPGQHVGLLFPASAGGSLAVMAAILAGKVPVLLNWTAGKRAILHACESTDLSVILSSRAFLDIVPTDLQFIEDRFLLIEDVREKMTTKQKLAAKRLASESASQILSAFGQEQVNPDSPAVVLFTSGSEALPKGVPLTHRNILSDIAGILDAFPLKRDDVLLGFLPPFHSFGLTVCTMLPMLCGLRVAYHPNPNESRKIAKAIAAWQTTITAGTPTFLRSILRAGAPEQFATLRALVSGAERAPQELFDQAASLPNPVDVLEGYGITECSPVVTMNRPGQPNVGVGRPLSGVTLKLVHPEDNHLDTPPGEQGLILVRGPTIFPGYLESNINPFVQLHNERWYNTGDLGKLQDGSLIITGRLKRFVKIAGEMVSLGAVEEALHKHVPSVDGTPSLALLVQGVEGDARPKLVLFSSATLATERANELLKQEGFPHLVHISEVRKVKEIPVLGSGKTDYQGLKAILAVG